MSDIYQRAYAKGYQAGMARGYRFVDKLLAAGRALRTRAERAERDQGLGTCAACCHWRRAEGCLWGHCNAPHPSDVATPWMAVPPNNGQIQTREDFGCVRFEHYHEEPMGGVTGRA